MSKSFNEFAVPTRAWETLAADCDQATTKCHMCGRYGHTMLDCPLYSEWHWEAKAEKKVSRWAWFWPRAAVILGCMAVWYLFVREIVRHL